MWEIEIETQFTMYNDGQKIQDGKAGVDILPIEWSKPGRRIKGKIA